MKPYTRAPDNEEKADKIQQLIQRYLRFYSLIATVYTQEKRFAGEIQRERS